MTALASLLGQLSARTQLVDGDIDILGATSDRGFTWWHHGNGIVTDGIAARVRACDVRNALEAIEVDAKPEVPGTGPVAVGVLPFDPAASRTAELVIPARLLRRDDEGRTWLTEIFGAGDNIGLQPDFPTATDRDSTADMSELQWASAVGQALERIEAGLLDKVVLARRITVSADDEFSIGDVVRRLREDQPGCYVFASQGLVGASPELLVRREGSTVLSRPMAGTAPHSDSPALEWLARSEKDRWEHALVVDSVVAHLDRLCEQRPSVSEPRAEPFNGLAHIVTDVVGRLSSAAHSVLDIALELHPTPAVAGVPTDRALEVISELETQPRGRYAGPVGWVDANGDGEFAVALRCAQVHANTALLYAGAGIVSGSTWQDEWRETDAKLMAMLHALELDPSGLPSR